jgi:flagellar motility protein MotE (MotC chaperone)
MNRWGDERGASIDLTSEENGMETRKDELGASTILSMAIVVLGGGLVMLVATLFLTGLAQERIIPMIQTRIDQAVSGSPSDEAPADSLVVEESEPTPDPADVLLAQIDTQKVFLQAQERELQWMRGQVDSLVAELQTLHNAEVTRQAKLFAAMKPDDAASVLASVDDPTLVAILKAMNARAASQVAAKIHPRRLAKLSMEGIAASEIAALANPVSEPETP